MTMYAPVWPDPIPDLPTAACKGAPLDWFVVPVDPDTGRRYLTIDNHKGLSLCAICPVRRECHRLPLIREDLIFGGVAYGSPHKGGRVRVLATAEGVAA
jgi:hypothetical protein